MTTDSKVKHKGILYPSKKELSAFYVPNPERMDYARRLKDVTDLSPVNLLLTGPEGGGKSLFAMAVAAEFGWGFAKIDVGAVSDPRDWLGFRDAQDGNTIFTKSLLCHAIENGEVVILLDEFNRVHASRHAAIMGLLDDSRRVYVDYLQDYVVVHPKTIIMATANIGARFAGTFSGDDAIWDRFTRIMEIDYPPTAQEVEILKRHTGGSLSDSIADKIVRVANQIRDRAADPQNGGGIQKGVSLRQTKDIAADIVSGMDPIQAMEVMIASHYSNLGGSGSTRATIRGIIQGIMQEPDKSDAPALTVRNARGPLRP